MENSNTIQKMKMFLTLSCNKKIPVDAREKARQQLKNIAATELEKGKKYSVAFDHYGIAHVTEKK